MDSRYSIISRLFWKTLAALLRRRENYKNVSQLIWLLFFIFIGKFHWKFLFLRQPHLDSHFLKISMGTVIFNDTKSFFLLYFISPSSAVDTTTSVSTGMHENTRASMSRTYNRTLSVFNATKSHSDNPKSIGSMSRWLWYKLQWYWKWYCSNSMLDDLLFRLSYNDLL